MRKFEYKTLSVESTSMWTVKHYKPETVEPQINALGQDGWELVSASPIDVNGVTVNMLFVFKREIG